MGLISKIPDALSSILHSNERRGALEDVTLEQAIEALAEAAEAVGRSRRIESTSSTSTTPIRRLVNNQRLQCNVRFLNDPAIHTEGETFRYLVAEDGRLIPINDVRLAREYNHYRVTLEGCGVAVPIQGSAMAFVSNESDLSGLTIEEVCV